MVNTIVVIAVLCFASALASPVPRLVPVAGENGQTFHFEVADPKPFGPIQAPADPGTPKFNTAVGYDRTSGGFSAQHRQNVLDTDVNQVNANAMASRNVHHNDNWSKGGGLDYLHKPSSSGFQVSAMNHPQAGTDVTGTGTYNVYQSPDRTFSAGVTAGRGHMNMSPGFNPREDFGMFHMTKRW